MRFAYSDGPSFPLSRLRCQSLDLKVPPGLPGEEPPKACPSPHLPHAIPVYSATHQDLLKGEVFQASVSRGIKDHREGFVRGVNVAKLQFILCEEERPTAGLLGGGQERGPQKGHYHGLGRTWGQGWGGGKASRAPSRTPIPESGRLDKAGEISPAGGWLLYQVALALARQAHVPRLGWETYLNPCTLTTHHPFTALLWVSLAPTWIQRSLRFSARGQTTSLQLAIVARWDMSSRNLSLRP